MIHGDGSQTHQRHGGRNAALLRQLRDQGCGAGMDDTSANVEDRPGRSVDQGCGRGQLGQRQCRSWIGTADLRPGLKLDHLVLDILGHVEQHRPGPP